MKNPFLILKRSAVAIIVIALVYVAWGPVWRGMSWAAWNWIEVDFIATCRVFEHDFREKNNDFELLYGPYSKEFLREVALLWDERYPDIELQVRKDGTLAVPLGFYLPYADPFWSKFTGSGAEVGGRGYIVSAQAAYRIFHRRLLDGQNMSDFRQYAERVRDWEVSDQQSKLHSDTCGFMEEVITVGGKLSSNDADTLQ